MMRLRQARRKRAVSPIIATVFLVGITITAGTLLWMFSVRPASPPPTVWYQAQGGYTYPAWGDPTDCSPVMPYAQSYYLGNGSGDARWSTYMNAWWSQCEYSTVGTYNNMNVSLISITRVSQPVLLSSVKFEFVCYNATPTPIHTILVGGSLQAMSWFPGSSYTLSANAPKLGSCGTFNATTFYHAQANGIYYNRLGFYDPLSASQTLLTPGDAFVLYVHTGNSVREAASPIEPQSTWNQPDTDDYHGAPPWCFANPGACTIYLIDTATSPNVVLATIPVTTLG
jgi:flagellin-like protein